MKRGRRRTVAKISAAAIALVAALRGLPTREMSRFWVTVFSMVLSATI